MFISDVQDGIILKIKVQPRSSKNRVAGIMGDALKICLTAPPVDGEANDSLVRYLSDLTKVSKSSVEIISGHTGRNKHIKILGMNAQTFKTMVGLGV